MMHNIGKYSEDYIEGICKDSFLADFVVRSPKYITQSGLVREISDLLLPFRDKLITFQVKTREVKEDFDLTDDRNILRIRRRIEQAIEQIKTIKRAIDINAITYVENLRSIKLPLDCSDPKKIIGIVILDLANSDAFSEEHNIAIYKGLDQVRDISVHVFLRHDFEIIAKELDTIPDLLEYLLTRETLMRKRILFPLTCELDFLATFKAHYDVIQSCLDGKVTELFIENGAWEKMQKIMKSKIAERDKKKRVSIIVDRIIEEVHRCIDVKLKDREVNYAKLPSGLEYQPLTVEGYMKIATELASLYRIDRMFFGSKILEKVQRADTDTKGFSYFVFWPRGRAIPMVFLSSRDSREELMMRLYSVVCAAYVHLGVDKIIGIGTQNYSAKIRAHDFMYFSNVAFENEEEIRGHAKILFGPLNKSNEDEWGNKYI